MEEWSFCSTDLIDGVCCVQPPQEECPHQASCMEPQDCYGSALNKSGYFIDYAPYESWENCSSAPNGICCINPVNPRFIIANKCGIRNYEIDYRLDPKIANKKRDLKRESLFGEFPWQAIIYYQNYTYNCGGTLISEKHVLTAAHCVNNLEPYDLKVRLGEWQINTFNQNYEFSDYHVHAIHIHPKFNPTNAYNDIALIELAYSTTFAYHINRVCMPTEGQAIKPGHRCVATGWGKASFKGN